MNGRSLIAAIMIVVSALASFATWFLGDSIARDIDKLGAFKQQGDLLVMRSKHDFYWINNNDEIVKQLAIVDLNVSMQGDYGFFANGDILLYHSEYEPSFADSLASFFRKTKKTEYQQNNQMGDDGFYRCDLTIRQCLPFGHHLPILNRTFKLTIAADDTIYLADTSAHTLYKLSSDGEIISMSTDSAYIFPNKIDFINQQLWVADTNNHRVVQVNIDTLQPSINQINTHPSYQHEWPHQFTSDGDSIWVNVANTAMAYGKIVKYSFDGKELARADLINIEDPMSIGYYNNMLWVSDFKTSVIERLNSDGNSYGRFEPAGLKAFFQEQVDNVKLGELFKLAGMIGFGLVLILGFAAAYILEKNQTKKALGMEHTPDSPRSSDINQSEQSGELNQPLYWLTNKAKRFYRGLQLVTFIFTLIFIYALFEIVSGTEENQTTSLMLSMYLFMMVMSSFLLYAFRYATASKLGVEGNEVIIDTPKYKTRIAIHQLQHTQQKSHLTSPFSTLAIGKSTFQFFDRKELEQYIFPYLHPENELPEMQLFKRLWQQKEPIFIVNGLAFFWLALGSGLLYLIAN